MLSSSTSIIFPLSPINKCGSGVSNEHTHNSHIISKPLIASSSLIFSQEQERIMKFSKQFEGQLVPEWKDAFVDYWQLKKDLKKFHLLNNINDPNTITTSPTSTRNQQHNSLANTIVSSLGKISLFSHHHHREHGAIQVYINSLLHFAFIHN